MENWKLIEHAANVLHQRLQVEEHKARCWLTPVNGKYRNGTRIVVQRLSDGKCTSTFVHA